MTEGEIRNILVRYIAKELKTNQQTVSIEDSFFDLGLDSISAMYLMEQLENELKIVINPLDFWDYPTINTFSKKLYQVNFEK